MLGTKTKNMSGTMMQGSRCSRSLQAIDRAIITVPNGSTADNEVQEKLYEAQYSASRLCDMPVCFRAARQGASDPTTVCRADCKSLCRQQTEHKGAGKHHHPRPMGSSFPRKAAGNNVGEHGSLRAAEIAPRPSKDCSPPQQLMD